MFVKIILLGIHYKVVGFTILARDSDRDILLDPRARSYLLHNMVYPGYDCRRNVFLRKKVIIRKFLDDL